MSMAAITSAVLLALFLVAAGGALMSTSGEDVDLAARLRASRRFVAIGAFLGLSPLAAFWLVIAVVILVPILLFFWFPAVGWLSFVAIVAAVAAAPRLLAPILARRRAEKFEEQLPTVADRLVSAVRGGTPLLQALETISPDLEPPIREAIVELAADATMGAGGMAAAIETARAKYASRHYALILSVLNVFIEQGGNLVEPMQRMSVAFKEIWRLDQKIRSATKAVRSAISVVNFGILAIVVIISFTRKESFGEIFSNPIGFLLFFAGMGIYLAGFYVMRQMMKVEI